ncbi:hypothetical protein [Albibacterium indicum]|uniref:hypothetical protein n=1 Tax=Albibacterium indicum TaxID=2292082 RepID=UPI0013007720|nr:hypothetical protein [Pedobacter indicus]
MEKINEINKVIANYFITNAAIREVQAKDLMTEFIAAGIFIKKHRDGSPIREVLRKLDARNELYKISYVFADPKKNTNWFFRNMG